MASTQYYDVYLASTGEFILRAELKVIAMIYGLAREAEARVIASGQSPTDLHFNGRRRDDINVFPVMTSWTPPATTALGST